MDLTRRALVGALAAAAAMPTVSYAASNRVDSLFGGFKRLAPNGQVDDFQGFGGMASLLYGDKFLAVYFGAAREVFPGCIADIGMFQDALLHEGGQGDRIIPVLVMPKPHQRDADKAFLDKFQVLQNSIPRAVILQHDDPNVVKVLGIRNGAPYKLASDGFVESHSRNIVTISAGGERQNTLDVETFRLRVILRQLAHVHNGETLTAGLDRNRQYDFG